MAESVTVAVKVLAPSALVVPEIAPVDGSRVRPLGSDPDVTVQE